MGQDSILLEQVEKYKWYHEIKVADGVYTPAIHPSFKELWDFNMACMDCADFKDKRVLDVGCRDGLFSFEAEKRGAKEVIAIDNDLSNGATEFLIPHFRSKVRMYELNLYELNPDRFGTFDIVIFFGVLYHLRFPFWGLKKVIDCLKDGGILLVESGMLMNKELAKREILFCPFENSPYEPSCCTFFNKQGLCTTMRSLNCKLLDFKTLKEKNSSLTSFLFSFYRKLKLAFHELILFVQGKGKPRNQISRQYFIFQKDIKIRDTVVDFGGGIKGTKADLEDRYWYGIHEAHTQKNSVDKNS